ncbi:MAG TPA: Ig-like domain-containing protein [Candidatus Competibacter sp.]|nr:Ig-like domain-containing protein [Candidatus Competibacter sp.]
MAQTLTPTSINFGNVTVGTTSSPQTITLTNNDPQSAISVVGVTAGNNFFATNCPAFLPALSGCAISVTFVPSALGTQTGTLSVVVDTCGDGCIETLTASLSGVGVAPINAGDDAVATDAGRLVTIDVLANDTPITGLTIIQVSDPPNGSAVISGNAIVYTPNPGFASPPNDAFTYTVRDSFQQTATATVTVTVRPPGLSAADDAAATDAGRPVTIDVLANDTPITGLTIIQVSDPPNGSAVISGNAIVYTPNPGFASPPNDAFTYTVQDSFERTATATVTVTVRPPGLSAADDAATTTAGTPVAIPVLANDTGTGLTIIQVSDPPNGSAAISGNAIVYTPDPGFASPPNDAFTYTVRDSFQRTATATVTVTVRPPGLSAADDAATTAAGTPVTIPVLANDAGTGIAIVSVGSPSNGTASVSGNAVVYAPKAGFTGTDSFSYTIRDSFGRTATATVTVTVRPPTLDAVDDSATTPARTAVTVPVLANDAGTGLTIVQIGTPAHGSAVAGTSGTIIYTPASNFAGTDSFAYSIRDSFGQTDTARVRITVVAPALDAVDDAASARTRVPVSIPVLANDIGAGLIVTQVGAPSHGSAVAGSNGTITYTSASNFTGTDTFTYTITDGISTDTATVTVTVTRNKEDIQTLLEETTDNPNARTIGRAIGGLCFDRAASANFLRDCDTLIDAASNGDSGVGLALEQITPTVLGTALDTSQTSAQTQMLSIRSRMASLRTGVMGINLDRLNIQHGGWTLSGRDLRYLLASLGGGGPSADVDTNLGALGIFASGTFNFGNRDGTENQTGFDFKTREVTLGADYRFTGQFVLGTAFSYTAVDTDMDSNGGYLDTRGYGLTLYGTYYPSDRFYVEGMVSYGWNDYDQRRNVAYRVQNAAVNQSFDSSYNGQQFFADLGAGYEFARGNLSFGPEVRLSYLDMRLDSFQERTGDGNPGSAWAVAIEEQDLQSLVSSVGGRASYLIDRPWGILQPQVEFSWLHEFEDDSRFVRGRFVEGAVVPDNLFQLVTDPVDKDYFRLGLGLSARFNRGPAALLQYRTLFGYRNLEDHAISAELRWDF